MQTALIFAVTNMVQLTIVFNVIIPPVECAMTCFVSLMAGTTLIPTFIVMNGIAMTVQPYDGSGKKVLTFIARLMMIMLVALFPIAGGYLALLSQNECPDSNSFIWFIQGLTIPASVWTIAQIFQCNVKKPEQLELQPIRQPLMIDEPPPYVV